MALSLFGSNHFASNHFAARSFRPNPNVNPAVPVTGANGWTTIPGRQRSWTNIPKTIIPEDV